MPLQVGIVGCGAVAQRLYCKPLQQLENCGILRVASLVDPVADHAAALGRFFAGAATFRQLDEALNSSFLDLVLVLSPAHLHCDHVVKALSQDVHVLCEKPMASTAVDCARMQEVALERKRVLAIGMIRRYFPAFAELKQIIDEGRLGTLQGFEYREGHKFEWEVTTPAAFRPRAAGGTGVLFDIGPHVIDHLAWTFGELQVTRYADDALAGIESNASIDVVSPVCPGSIHLSWDSPQTNELRVFGANGEAVLRIDRFDQLAVLGPSGFEACPVSTAFPADVRPAPASTMTPLSYSQAIYCQIVQVARAIALGEAPAVGGESGHRTVAVLESALSLAEPLAMPWLEVAEQEAFARLHWRGSH